VLIISGGYGILTLEEPIGIYDAVFNTAWWPIGLLEAAILAYAKQHSLSRVMAFLSASTSYRKLFDRVDWQASGISEAILLSPLIAGGGAMVKAPRAQGEAFSAVLRGEFSADWRSSDGASIEWHRVVA
jgi:hypothetical protein